MGPLWLSSLGSESLQPHAGCVASRGLSLYASSRILPGDSMTRTLIATLLLVGAASASSQSLIERGEYLARAGDCVSCHTASGGAPFAGGLRIDTPFGYMLTPNITPDA